MVEIDDRIGSAIYAAPRRIDQLNVDAGFAYAPVHFSIDLRKLTLRGADPELLLRQLSGKIAVRDDNLYLDDMAFQTAETSLAINGVVERYLRDSSFKLTADGRASLPELGRILKWVAGYDLHPTLNVNMNGPLDRLAHGSRRDLGSRARPRARDRRFQDARSPVRRAQRARRAIEHRAHFKSPDPKTDVTGDATFDVTIFSDPTGCGRRRPARRDVRVQGAARLRLRL